MLPIPFKKFIPKIFHDDSKTDNLSNKIDQHLRDWKKDVMELMRSIRPDECDSKYLDELNILLNANIKNYDSDLVRRKKIAQAIQNQKFRGCFNLDVKLRIDLLTGYSSRIIDDDSVFGSDDRILLSDGGIVDGQATAKYWSVIGCDGLDADQGMAIVGDHEVWIKVNIFIDLHQGINTPVLTTAEIDRIVLDLNDVIPAYFYVFLGYIDAFNRFQEYRMIG